MIKSIFLILLVFMFSFSLKAQNASDLFDQAVSQYNEHQYFDAKKNIKESITLSKEEKWDKENWVLLLIWESKIESEIDKNQAINDYLYVLELCNNTLGKDHSYYGIGLNNLAGLYAKIGEYSKALPLYYEALENTEKSVGKEHSDYGVRLNNLAAFYEIIGEYSKALPLYLEALENTEKSLGKDHPGYGISLNNLAELYRIIGDYGKALPLYLAALENTEKSLGKDDSRYGIRLNNLAGLYKSMGEYSKALPLLLEALENTEKSLGKIHPKYGARLNNLAALYESMGEYDKALPLYLEALKNTEKSLGKDHLHYGIGLSNLAELYRIKGDFTQALPLYLEALENTEKILGKDHSEYGIRLNNLAEFYKSTGEYAKALPLYLEALENTENNLGKDHSQYGAVLNNLGVLYEIIGEYTKALPLFLIALENAKHSLGRDHSDYGIRLNNLAELYKTMGEYTKALPLLVEALENTKMSLGKDHSSYGAGLRNLAGLYAEMGEYAKALPLYIEALENTEKSLGKDHSQYGIGLNSLATMYARMGEYTKALPLYIEALENTEKSLGKNHSEYGIGLNNLAGSYESMGEYVKALNFYLEAIENTEKSLGKGHSRYALVLSNLALLYQSMGEYAKALPLNLEALEITEKCLGKDHSDYGIRLNNLALLYKSMSEYAKALHFYMEALENADKSLGKDHSQYGLILNNLAGLYEKMGEYAKALAFYQNGIESNKRFLTNNILGLSEDSKASLIKKDFFYTEVMQSLIVQFPDSNSNIVTKAWENILFYKGLALKSSNLLKEKLQSSNDTIIVNMIAQLDLYQNLINRELARPIEKQSPSLSDYQTKAKAAELELLTKSQDFKELKEGLSAKYEDMIKHLKPGEVAMDFTNFGFHKKVWTDTTYYVAYIIRPELAKPKMVVLFTEKELLDIVNISTTSANSINTNYLKRGATPVNNELSTTNIYDLIWEKLTPYLSDVNTVYLSPSGYLSKVSFAAMQDSTGKYLGEKYQINYMLSLTDLLFEKTTTIPTSFLLAGGINYEYDATKKEAIKDTFDLSAIPQRGLRGNTWTYLKGTKIESQKIESLLKAAEKETIYFSEENATEKNIKWALTQSPSVFHIATHGFYIPMETKHEEIDFQKENVYKANEDPMYRSGLLLAGGNYAWENGGNPYEEEDGILLAKEISTMNLSNTQLVVLSACETGLGDLNGSEGVMGLQRALKMAGVQYQITTLWQVPDAETVEFMELFYTDWIRGGTIEKSFNKAQLTMSKKYAADPYKWGAFVLYK